MIKIITAEEVRLIAVDLKEVYNDFWPALLFGGDRILHCDEGMVATDDDGRPIGLASIAPKGESGMGTPEIVGVYVIPTEREKGIGLSLLKAAAGRCRERGLAEPSMTAVCRAGKALVSKFYLVDHGGDISGLFRDAADEEDAGRERRSHGKNASHRCVGSVGS